MRNDWHVVERAIRKSDRKPVLLKRPHQNPFDPFATNLLEREFSITRDLRNTGIPQVLEFVEDSTGCRLVLEDPGGVPLSSILTVRKMPLEDVLGTGIELAQILVELHRANIVHGNVSPHNILVDPATGKLNLLNFSLALRGSGEGTPIPPQLLGQALLNISPEQTGRMNRTTDYRADFYSLGATFFEILTGTPTFQCNDTLELIHSHIARNPTPPSEIDPAIPRQLSGLVMKLLSKTAEDRYQSALGIKHDLVKCLGEWSSKQRIDPFPLGKVDVSDQFLISQKLYGRDVHIASMLKIFNKACEGPSAMLLVSGYSGVGKSSLIQELYRPIVSQRGYFTSGKFDQVTRNTPFGALIEALKRLVQQLLTEGEDRLAYWHNRISHALGTSSGVITEVIPEVQMIVGKQPPPPSLGPTEAQNRFRLAFQNFVAALASADHPLVIFLDDLQWADLSTLELVGPLLTAPELKYLLLIGAYRENEVDALHPLTFTLKTLERAGAQIEELRLGPLELPHLKDFLLDTLHGNEADILQLARLVQQKTDGNPFFAIQFLKTLHQEQLLSFDYAAGRWRFKLEAIHNAGMTNNVIDLMVRKIQRLPNETREALKLAACIGNQFELDLLALISQRPVHAIASDLDLAVKEGLLLTLDRSYESTFSEILVTTSYRFAHDQIQDASYALIPDNEKQVVHLTIGRLMRDQWPRSATENKLFDIASQLNRGHSLITDEMERLSLARLNLNAGLRAKNSTAFRSALNFFSEGAGLLVEDHWITQYELTFKLNFEAAECDYLCGNFDSAERELEVLLKRAQSTLDKARIHTLRIVQYENLTRYTEALASAYEALSLLGLSIPAATQEKQDALEREINSIKELLGERSIESLINLPVSTDPEICTIMSTLTAAWPSAYLTGDLLLTQLLSAMMVRLSLVNGNTEASDYGYVTHAIMVGPIRGQFKSAYEYGRLALRVNERFADPRRKAKIHQQFQAHVNPWRRPLRTCIAHAREACRSGLEAGDFTYATYGAFTETWAALLIANDLDAFVREYSGNLALIEKLKLTNFADAQRLLINWIRALKTSGTRAWSLASEEFQPEEFKAKHEDKPFFTSFYFMSRLHLAYLSENYQEALQVIREAQWTMQALRGTIWPVVWDFWRGLTITALHPDAATDDFRDDLESIRDTLATLADNCPENFLCYSLLLSAEAERIAARHLSAVELYERAISYSKETDHMQNLALANELYARFWSGRGHNTVANSFRREAHKTYKQIGAQAKVTDLETRYPLSVVSGPLAVDYEPLTSHESLDLKTAMKAAQAIIGEIDLEKLVERLMHITIENAAAQRAALILEQDGRPLINSLATLDTIEVMVQHPIPLEQTREVAQSIVNYARRTHENIVIADAGVDERYRNDPYIVEKKPRSIMCTPIVKQGSLIGVLYLENNLATNVFTTDRSQVMQLLASEASISLDNARLYKEMKQEAEHRRRAEQSLRSIIEGTAGLTGGDFFYSLVRHLATALHARYAFVTQCLDQTMSRVRTLAFWSGDDFVENVEYELEPTPCKQVIAGETCFYSDNLQGLFPRDVDLAALNAQSFFGIPLLNSTGLVIGHLAVLDDKPMEQDPGEMPVLKIFAARAGAELVRLKAEEDLRTALKEVENLKNRLQAENVYLQEEISQEHHFSEIIGSSSPLLKLLDDVEKAAPTDATVLILGETGTGKELIARAIHTRSSRKERPLVKVNCGAISAGLVESELFGHVKGAFTGAIGNRIGRFELADGGTLFLDEVSELPLETQVKLLRVLQEGEFEAVGSSKTNRVDVRIIAATNRNLQEGINAGRFRADLYYRLNVLPLNVPPLRERVSDIPQLVMFFLTSFAKKLGKKVDSVTQETMQLLTSYSWPGNIRELQNVIERGVVLSQSSVLTLSSELFSAYGLKRPVPQIEVAAAVSSLPAGQSSSGASTTAVSLEDVERRHILAVLERSGWVIEGAKGAARVLNLHPNTLRSRMKKLGIQRVRT